MKKLRIEVTRPGAVVIISDGRRKMRYIGYTIRDAVRKFKNEVKK